MTVEEQLADALARIDGMIEGRLVTKAADDAERAELEAELIATRAALGRLEAEARAVVVDDDESRRGSADCYLVRAQPLDALRQALSSSPVAPAGEPPQKREPLMVEVPTLLSRMRDQLKPTARECEDCDGHTDDCPSCIKEY